MKVAVVFILLFATVLCRPARKVSDSSSESSEEVVRRPAVQAVRKQAPVVPQARAAPVQKLQNVVAAAAAGSDESSDEDEQAAAQAPVEVKSDSTDTASASTTASVNSSDSEDSDDDDDEEEAEESETEEEEDESNSESGESSTPAPATVTPMVVTEGPVAETTAEPIVPTIVTDTETARGDNLGGYPGEYKSIIYVEDKSYHKIPAPYKSYEFVDTGKKTAYDMTDGNEVEKSLKVYKVQAIQVHSDLLEEDTSTPEVESQGLDASSGTSQDISPRQASLPEEEESASTSDATSESESTSTPEEEEVEEEEEESASTSSDSASASEESEDEESQSSEEATATPGAADSDSEESDSTESDSDEEGAGPDTVTDIPPVITAK